MNNNHFSPGLHKLIHHQGHLAKIQNREIVSPIHISIWPTNSCQLDCEYCCFNKVTRNSNELKLEDFCTAVDVLAKYGLKALELSGGGDPLLWTHFNAAVDYAFKRKIKLSLVTNGLALENIPKDILSKFNWIRISVQSRTYAEKINLAHLPIGVRKSLSYIVYDKQSLDEIKKLHEYAKENNIVIRVAPIRPCELEWEQEVANEVEKCGYPLLFFKKESGPPLGCYMVWLRAAIDWDGNFLPCPSIELSFESAGKIPEDFSVCKIEGLEEWLKNNPVHDMGYRCSFCNCGKGENDFIHSLLQEVEDVDFV